MWNIIVGDWHFRGLSLSMTHLAEKLREMGFSGMEVGIVDPAEQLNPERMAELQIVLTKIGVPLLTFFLVPRLWPEMALTSHDSSVRKKAVLDAKWVGDAAQRLGIKTVGFWPGGDTLTQEDYAQRWKWMTEGLSSILEHFDKLGLKLAFEYKPEELVHHSDGLLRILDQLKANNLGLLLDTGHLFIAGENPVVVAEKFRGKLYYVHFDDNFGDWDRDLPPGRVHNFLPFVRKLREIGYAGPFGLDLSAYIWGNRVDPVKACLEGKGYLESICLEFEEKKN
jgi:sugar phosphate isomerase/epimerase